MYLFFLPPSVPTLFTKLLLAVAFREAFYTELINYSTQLTTDGLRFSRKQVLQHVLRSGRGLEVAPPLLIHSRNQREAKRDIIFNTE